jgi:hypothetical protein
MHKSLGSSYGAWLRITSQPKIIVDGNSQTPR